MKQEYKEKKQFFQSFAVALATALIAGLNSFPVFAEESPNTETTAESFQQEQYDDSGEEADDGNVENNVSVTETETETGSDIISAEETVDVDAAERVAVVCKMIDSLPTVEMLYENAPDETKEGYAAWLLETDHILKGTGNIQEQYNVLSAEEKNAAGEDRKIKLEGLCQLAAILSEKLEGYTVDSLFTDESEDVTVETDSDTIPSEETVDMAAAERVTMICTMIDSLPTVEMLYENVPGETEEGYGAWLSETDNILKEAAIIQEQYDTLSVEEQNLVGEERKIKLEELCGFAAMLSEKVDVYLMDPPFTDENGVSYQVIQDGSDSNVEVVPSGDYTVKLGTSLIIPKQVLYNDKMYNVTKIQDRAFTNCSNLTSVEIPDSVTDIGLFAFYNCINIQSVTLSGNISVGIQAFAGCSHFETLNIIINNEINTVTVDNSDDNDAFENCPGERSLVFILEDGTELTDSTTPALKTVIDVYKAVDDGDTEDDLWYGWELPVSDSMLHTVTITVQKDDTLWENSNRIFGLKKDGSDLLIMELSEVEDGDYKLYDITEVSNGVDTGIPVTVNGEDVQDVVVDYYTVTFYDGDIPYGDDAAQQPQIVLKNLKCVKPSDPEKEDYLFDGWVTIKDGDVSFDFDNTNITAKTNIYASWTQENIQEYIIAASAQGDGSITPEGDVTVNAGENITFTFEPGEGSYIKSVMVDGQEINLTEQSYTFENVDKDHTIEVIFEEDENSENPDPDDGDDNPGEDTPGAGDIPGNEDTPGVGDNPGGDTPGNEDTPGVGDNPGGDTPGNGDTPGVGDNPGGDTPGNGDTPGVGDNPGGDTPGSGDTPGVGDNPGGDTPGNGDTPGVGDNPGGDTPGSGDTPDAGDNSEESSKKPANGGNNNNSGNSSDNNTNSSNNQTQNDVVTNNNVPLIVSNNNIDDGIAASNTDIVYNNTEEYNLVDSPKDNEPATGDNFHIEIYIIIAMTAGLALLLFSFADIRRYLTIKDNIKKHML